MSCFSSTSILTHLCRLAPLRLLSTTVTPPTPTYSYIVIGAGSAGCVLAHRLSESSSESVLLLEAGPKDKILGSTRLSWQIHMPAALTYNLCHDKYNWFYHTLPQSHMDGRVMYWPRGRVWGGSSSLNAMVYIRGHAEDYNRWHREGAEGWDYEHCLPYFRKAQKHELGPDRYRGGDGPLCVSRGRTNHPLHRAFIQAGQEAGYPFTEDMNGFQQEGVGWMDMTIHKGKRWSTASAYLRPALSRSNLTAEVRCMVTRLLFDGTRARGVEYRQNGQIRQVFADKEVILSGGAINSPQLLMLSGVGNADDLRKLNIPVVQHLPGYGATAHLESGGFIRSRPDVPHPDIQFHFLPSQVIDHGRVKSKIEAFQVHVGPMRSTSVGWLKLKSRDPMDHPIIQPNYLSTDEKASAPTTFNPSRAGREDTDVQEFRQCIRLTREIFSQKAFDPFRGPEEQPGASIQTDAELDAFVRSRADSAYHPSCTCRMGQPEDIDAVVDPQLRVFGVEGLRVVDASVMPSMVSGNLNAPTIMIAEKAADAIKGLPSLQDPGVPVYQPQTLQRYAS
ncbi:hypothetical protein DNTS_011406 [Danionella cerebrum]|uniref:Glucose-methanol-choline oxidoreductase N-terminal domain-containing protein n=1 Tax=Danionella cerebrum TaxID=2873325 RepID=A0A553PVZ4_9TELE|nr:hypothetical protein DNTS_011406 [Danionella translucida]TRY81841.1 hypothetical protein DNTS_011406 [Danionella translucida]